MRMVRPHAEAHAPKLYTLITLIQNDVHSVESMAKRIEMSIS